MGRARQLKAIQRNQDKYLCKEQRPNLRTAPNATYTALILDGKTGDGVGGSIVVLKVIVVTV
jgi:hypothetical protein